MPALWRRDADYRIRDRARGDHAHPRAPRAARRGGARGTVDGGDGVARVAAVRGREIEQQTSLSGSRSDPRASGPAAGEVRAGSPAGCRTRAYGQATAGGRTSPGALGGEYPWAAAGQEVASQARERKYVSIRARLGHPRYGRICTPTKLAHHATANRVPHACRSGSDIAVAISCPPAMASDKPQGCLRLPAPLNHARRRGTNDALRARDSTPCCISGSSGFGVGKRAGVIAA